VNRIRIFTALLPVFLLLVAGQPARAQNGAPAPQAAMDAADGFLALIDQRQYDESWASCAPAIKNTINKQSWGTVLSINRARFGVLGTRKLVSAQTVTSLPGSPDGQYAILRYRSSFTLGKTAMIGLETVTLAYENGKWLGYQYAIRNPAKKHQ
jgi:hypothetical protein